MPASAVVLAVLLASGIVLGSILALRDDPATGTSCDTDVTVNVMTSPRMAPVIAGIAEAYKAKSPKVDGRCVTVTVVSRATADTVAALSGGWSDSSAGPVPDVWIPESKSWLTLARNSEDAARLLPDSGTTIATSPVVLAVPRDAATVLGWPQTQVTWSSVVANNGNRTFWSERGHPEWGPFRVGLPDPATSSAGLSSVLDVVSASRGVPPEQIKPEAFGEPRTRTSILTFERAAGHIDSADALFAGLREADGNDHATSYLSAFPIQESELVAYNRGQTAGADATGRPSATGTPSTPRTPLAAFYPPDAVTIEEIPYVVLHAAAADPRRAPAAADFLSAIRGPIGQQPLAAAGFRAPDGTNPALDEDAGVITALPQARQGEISGATLAAAAATFRGIHQRAATLAVFDSSASMTRVVPGSGGLTRMQVAVQAALGALPMYADDSELGLWHFATQLDGDRDWVQLVPIGPLDEQIDGVSRRETLTSQINDIQPSTNTGLYDTTLAAFRTLSSEYAADKVNQVLLLTDGANDDPAGGISLQDLLTTIRAEFDPNRPVQIITIAYGEEANQSALRQISEATGAKSYTSLDPNDISQVLVDALIER
jgi:Ca-activated chloride channel family protein